MGKISGMNPSNFDNSPHLQAIVKLMMDGRARTGLGILKYLLHREIVPVYGISTMISELRHSGYHFPEAKYIGKTGKGKKIYEYVLLSWPA